MSSTLFTMLSDGSLDVPLHRQDTPMSCGGACLQMILGAMDNSPGAPDQQILMEAGNRRVPRNTECSHNSRHWYLCPESMARMLHVPGKLEYRVSAFGDRNVVLAQVADAVETHGLPSVLLVDGGRHWLVVHGVRREQDSQAICFSVRDPWPPLRRSGPHTHCNCPTAEGSPAAQLLLPAGIHDRFTPCRAGEIWINDFVAVVPAPVVESPRENGAREGAGPSPSNDSTASENAESLAVAAAREGAAAANRSGWGAAPGVRYEPGMVVAVNDFKSSSDLPSHRTTLYHLVELRPISALHAPTLVAVVSSKGPRTLELIALDKQTFWLKAREVLEKEKGRIIANAPASSLPAWLREASLSSLNIGYIWHSSPDSRSRFHPWIQMSTPEHQAKFTPEGALIGQ